MSSRSPGEPQRTRRAGTTTGPHHLSPGRLAGWGLAMAMAMAIASLVAPVGCLWAPTVGETDSGETTTAGTTTESASGGLVSTVTTALPTTTAGSEATGPASDTDTDTGDTADTADTEGTEGTENTGEDPEATLCGRLGGEEGIDTLHRGFHQQVLADDRINGYFLNAGVDLAERRRCLNLRLGEFVGCPGVVSDCALLAPAHEGLGIGDLDFSDYIENYSVALEDHSVEHPALTTADRVALLGSLLAGEDKVVSDPGSDLTLYQRLGRKPAIRGVVGDAESPGTLVHSLLSDPMINGFFTGIDPIRLATCWTRRLSSVSGGPVVYTAEVDSPAPGIDEGVAADDPCLGLSQAHGGLKHSGDQSVVEASDFTQVLILLGGAMADAGLAADLQNDLLGILLADCEEVVAKEQRNSCPGNSQSINYTYQGLPILIPDDLYNGSKASMVCASIPVPETGVDVITAVELEIGIDHTWLGDLVIKIYSPKGKVVTVLSRAGFPEVADDGSGQSPEGSNLAASAPIAFYQTGPFDAETLGNGQLLGNSGTACVDDNRCDFFPNHGAAAPGNLLSFAGDLAFGTWEICVGDGGAQDTGVLKSARLKVRSVKYPG